MKKILIVMVAIVFGIVSCSDEADSKLSKMDKKFIKHTKGKIFKYTNFDLEIEVVWQFEKNGNVTYKLIDIEDNEYYNETFYFVRAANMSSAIYKTGENSIIHAGNEFLWYAISEDGKKLYTADFVSNRMYSDSELTQLSDTNPY